MTLLALGINHKTAPVEVRERVAFAPENLAQAMHHACSVAGLKEVAILSTCNRTEIYGCSSQPCSEKLLAWLAHYHDLDVERLLGCSYQYEDDSAVRHMMRVASGLDSLVLGEPQILGQLKSAYSVAQEEGVIGAELGRLFRHAFTIAKQVRTHTAIGQNPVSVAYAAVSMAQHIFADLNQSRALLIGAGETIELVARHLYRAGVRQLTVANRTLGRALDLAALFDAKAIALGDIPDVLPEVDIIISSTASQLPILGKGAVETALKKRRHKPFFMVDIAVPRDIEPQVGQLDDVYLYTVDDLKEVIEENQRGRESAAREAEQIIDVGAHDFMRQLRELDVVDTVTALREHAHSLCEDALEKAQRQLAAGKAPEHVMEVLARGLTNKLLHQPTVQLREASADGRDDLQQLVKELFQLSRSSTAGRQD